MQKRRNHHSRTPTQRMNRSCRTAELLSRPIELPRFSKKPPRQQQFSNFEPIAPAQATQQASTNHPAQHRLSAFSSTLQTIPDMDTVEDMEMDDINSRGSRLTSATRLRRCGTSDNSAIRLSHHTKNVWL